MGNIEKEGEEGTVREGIKLTRILSIKKIEKNYFETGKDKM